MTPQVSPQDYALLGAAGDAAREASGNPRTGLASLAAPKGGKQ